MHKIEINRVNFQLPSSFSEIDLKQLGGFLSTVFSNMSELEKRVHLVYALAPLKAHAVLKKLNEVQFAQVAALLNWVMDDLPVVANPHSFQISGELFIGPQENMATSVMAEFLFADNYLMQAKKDPEKIYWLTAVLYRPENKRKRKGDRRQKLDTDVLEEHAQAMKKLPAGVPLAAMAYMIAAKKMMAATYPKVFQTSYSEESEEVDPTTVGNAWVNAMLSIAENGVFGTMEKVKYTNVHEVLLYLEKKEREAEKQKK